MRVEWGFVSLDVGGMGVCLSLWGWNVDLSPFKGVELVVVGGGGGCLPLWGWNGGLGSWFYFLYCCLYLLFLFFVLLFSFIFIVANNTYLSTLDCLYIC